MTVEGEGGIQVSDEQLQPREVYHGKLIRVRVQPVRRPDGKISQYELVDHPNAAAIVAVRYSDGAGGRGEPLVALVRQQRPAIGKDTWEIPAGLVNDDERDDAQRTAARELREETGYDGSTFVFLNRHYASPGFMNEAISIYLATDLRQASGRPAPDPHEIDQIEWKPLGEAISMCRNGEIEDGKTVIGLLLARDTLAEMGRRAE